MKFKIYHNGGLYCLDSERGKGKIYEIINNSTPVRVDKLFSEPVFADVPTGTYYFYFDNYTLMATWSLGEIYILFDLIHRCITHRLNLLMTVDYEGIYSYVVALPVDKDDVRLVFLDRKEPDCRDYVYRYKDPELTNTVAAKDIIINRYELIKQFNAEVHRVYNENKYYLSKEYEQKCKEEHATVCQEYVLKYAFHEYSKIFDKYLQNPDKFWEETFYHVSRWDANVYKTPSELKEFINKLDNKFIGGNITKIMVMGNIFNDDRPYYTYRKGRWYSHVFDTSKKNNICLVEEELGTTFDATRTEDVSLTLDEPIAIFVKDNEGLENHFDIDFTKSARFKMKPNSFNFWEKSYFASCQWQDVSKYFSKNIVGHKIVDVEVVSLLNNEEIDIVNLVMDNSKKLELTTDNMTLYMTLSEI